MFSFGTIEKCFDLQFGGEVNLSTSIPVHVLISGGLHITTPYTLAFPFVYSPGKFAETCA